MKMSNVASNRTVASCYTNGATNIPLPKSKTTAPPLLDRGMAASAEKWRTKYEESERKRKTLLAQAERTSRDYTDLERKFKQLQLKNSVVENELSDKSEQLLELRTVSKNLFKEYDSLKNQYDTETEAMHRALTEASNWYKQNKELKRQSMLLSKGIIPDVVDNSDTEQNELEGLRDSVRQLSAEIGRLQADLNSAKLMEFEATEQLVNLSQELENERRKREELESEIAELKNSNEQMIRISKMMSAELEELRGTEKRLRESTDKWRLEADSARRERNVLAHQSTLLMQDIPIGGEQMQLLYEIEQLKRQLEDEKNRYEHEISVLQEKLEERENDSEFEVLEERLKLAECELQHALARAERAEQKQTAPPPPPPPPLPPANGNAVKNGGSDTPRSKEESVQDMAEALGMDVPQRKPRQPAAAIDDIINQIKGGKFTLRTTNKSNLQKPREEPKAVSEMLNILGTLRRCPRVKKDVADVLL